MEGRCFQTIFDKGLYLEGPRWHAWKLWCIDTLRREVLAIDFIRELLSRYAILRAISVTQDFFRRRPCGDINVYKTPLKISRWSSRNYDGAFRRGFKLDR